MAATLILIFSIGYCAIALEKLTRINKAAAALLTGVVCWTAYGAFSHGAPRVVEQQLVGSVSDISGILFFLMGAMTIVELIDSYQGFCIITDRITLGSRRSLLWTLCGLTFFLSAVLDNLTTTIIMVSLLVKVLEDRGDRPLFAGMIVIAANAGGAWTPIGDVTTTMLWIGDRISSTAVMSALIIPSLLCLIVPLVLVSLRMKDQPRLPPITPGAQCNVTDTLKRNIIFFSGLAVLVLVPVFKAITHLPPYMGILFGLGVLWVITEIMNLNEKRDEHSVSRALRNIDLPSILFFLGILLAVAALHASGLLPRLAAFIDINIENKNMIILLVGLLSSIVDNVPLVAAVMNMYDLSQIPKDHHFWMFLSYCAGTGGSCLVIGSAAGIAAMGIVKIDFFWYVKKIAPLALVGYLAGALWFILVG
jgi:Na+/H+ antiporter NhaD/arsenite permease-like protein